MNPRRRGSLASLVLPRMIVTVAVMAILMCLGTVLAARSILFDQLTNELNSVQERQLKAAHPGDVLAGISSPGIPDGTIMATKQPDGRAQALVIRIAEGDRLTQEEVLMLLDVQADGMDTSLTLPGAGSYRVRAYETSFGKVTIGLPTDRIDTALARLTWLAAALSALAVIATALVTREVLQRATRKLSELTDTADNVSHLELERGSVEVPRVDVGDLPEDNEVTRLSAAFNQMLSNVESALTSREASETKLRRFVADASHELRNPLAAIRGYAELAQRHPDADGAMHAMGRIESESTRMSKLVNDLLLLARLDSDVKTAPSVVDAVEVVVNAVSDSQAASRDHRWLLDVPSSEVEVSADPDQLHQVMVNLLSNARTHTPAGTTVHTSVHVSDGIVVIAVSDDGPGVPPETLPKVFERFTRADEARTHTAAQSTGLGLAIVKALVEGWGGTADVASRPGLTTFEVRLPLVDRS
ncbi:two-component system, OmpR family, sensor kinase [Tessaracoccus bendigoensis DSM 12906]|uniref:histidine kinase n=1 Tax=Tessaracoccus bendigoensis DSM 12906 TaxID=1123357 RepID=A0A1M6ELE0_9ACTN|nr:HAMP domain-containing sensor histidine kinase [Tessaracoccus bendigoensis]SHI86332.1 two-component system, OmpR family, sensor kinase [Tessaracoccus bendigoensis DSM 12906]